MKNAVIAILALTLLAVAVYAFVPKPPSQRTPVVPAVQPGVDLELVSSGISARRYGNEYTTVIGEVRNDSAFAVSHVPVTVILRDRAGALVGSGTTFVEPDRLAPGMSGAFQKHIRDLGDRGMTWEVILNNGKN